MSIARIPTFFAIALNNVPRKREKERVGLDEEPYVQIYLYTGGRSKTKQLAATKWFCRVVSYVGKFEGRKRMLGRNKCRTVCFPSIISPFCFPLITARTSQLLSFIHMFQHITTF